MRQGMLSPRFLVLHFQGTTGGALGIFEQMALLITECQHSVRVGNVGIGGHHFQNRPQHGRRIAAIEFQVLMNLGDDQIAGKPVRQFVTQPHRGGYVVGDPGTQHRDVELLSSARLRRATLGSIQIPTGMLCGSRCLQQHPQHAGVDLSHAAIRIRGGRLEHPLGARLIGKKSFNEIIHDAQR